MILLIMSSCSSVTLSVSCNFLPRLSLLAISLPSRISCSLCLSLSTLHFLSASAWISLIILLEVLLASSTESSPLEMRLLASFLIPSIFSSAACLILKASVLALPAWFLFSRASLQAQYEREEAELTSLVSPQQDRQDGAHFPPAARALRYELLALLQAQLLRQLQRELVRLPVDGEEGVQAELQDLSLSLSLRHSPVSSPH